MAMYNANLVGGGSSVKIDGVEYEGDLELTGKVYDMEISTLPYDFQNSWAVVFNGEIHILGGQYDNSYYNYHYKYNGTTWESVSTLPFDFYNGSAIVYNNEIHIFKSKNHYKFNGSSWESVSTLPYSFACGSAVVLNGEIHILGGLSSRTKHYTIAIKIYKISNVS